MAPRFINPEQACPASGLNLSFLMGGRRRFIDALVRAVVTDRRRQVPCHLASTNHRQLNVRNPGWACAGVPPFDDRLVVTDGYRANID